MSLIGKLFNNFKMDNSFVVDIDTFIKYLHIEEKNSKDLNEVDAVDIFIYYKGEKHEIKMWNYDASTNLRDKEKGFIICYDTQEYKSIDELLDNALIGNIKLKDINEYFKIETPEWTHVFLTEYKRTHPHVKIENNE